MEIPIANQKNDKHIQETEKLQLVLPGVSECQERWIFELETLSRAIRKEEKIERIPARKVKGSREEHKHNRY